MSKATKEKLFLISPMLHQGGFERVCITTARLLEDVYDITIVIFSNANIAYDISGLNIVNLDVPTKKGRFQKIINVLKRVHRMKVLKKKILPDISYSFGPTANLVNALSKTKATKVWLGLRNYTDVEQTLSMKLFVKRADSIIACSKEIESEVRKQFGYDKVYTLYNLYDVDKIAREAEEKLDYWPFEDDKRHTIVAMGRDDDQKSYWHMLKAFKLAHDRVSSAKLVILGAGNFELYKDMAKKLEIEDSVYFAGMRKDPYKFLYKSGIYLMTSYNEGFPNALVEGMSLGLASISTNCLTGPAEIMIDASAVCVQVANAMLADGDSENVIDGALYADYGILVPLMSKERNLDISDLSEEVICANVLINLLIDDEIYNKYSDQAKKRAGDFTYEAYKTRFIEIVNDMKVS